MVKDARQSSRRALYGAGLTVLLITSALLIFFLNDIIHAFDRRYALVVVMPSAPGITEGSPVWIGGKVVGEITTIGFLPSGGDTTETLALTVDLPRRQQRLLRTDSRARLTSDRMMGQPVIDLVPGSSGARILSDGDTIHIEKHMSADDLRQRAGIVRAELDTTMQLMRQLAPPLRARLTQTRRVFRSLEVAMVDARRLQRDIGASPNFGLMSDPALQAALERSRANAAELSSLIASFRERMATQSELRATVTRLQQRADSVRTILDETSKLLDAGFLGRMQNDSALQHAMHAARAELDSLIAETRRNPLRFFFK
jgi:ABC-type transporter Mla subunit MlaD